ncbi:alpha/beta fold hydrolase [Thomasclavelia sp.]|uniref:alpha/beta fold hydrolase n=1 Tax=Thomasclavelia sp. TaxID=3025757 RepID=UPI0025D412E7|nr:alpha/beta fold hydrolase [Thomasclavelia sp.]
MLTTETFTSVTATHVKFDIYLPTVMIRYKAIVQIHHAMSEYSDRYKKFAEYLAHEGYVVVVSDFPGHGTSLYNFEQGYFGAGDATKTLVEDMHRLRNIMAARYPELPYFMIGNQFGSLVLRQYLAKYGDFVQGVVLMGTCGKQHFIRLKKLIIKGDALIKGNMHRSNTISKNIINKLLSEDKNANYQTGDDRELKLYLEDPFTGFIYTNNAYRQIFDIIKNVSLNENIKKIPNYVSMLIVSGIKDPFGKFGIGPTWLYETLKAQGQKDITLKLYKDSHNDLLHDKQRLEIYQDILDWLNNRTYV